MTTNRIRRHPAYSRGRDYADGFPLDGCQWVSSAEGEQAFKAGYMERKKELEQEAEAYRLASQDLSLLLIEARHEQSFDKLCIVVERLLEARG